MTDRCAYCFTPLALTSYGARIQCDARQHRGAKPRYLSEAIPEPPHTLDASIVSKHGRPTLHHYG